MLRECVCVLYNILGKYKHVDAITLCRIFSTGESNTTRSVAALLLLLLVTWLHVREILSVYKIIYTYFIITIRVHNLILKLKIKTWVWLS